MMSRTLILLGTLFAFLGVAFGAFGAHALALVVTAWLAEKWPGRFTRWAGWLFAAGIILFSGSLYILAIFNAPIMGAVTPLGGAAFLAGWACLGWTAWKNS